MPPVADGTRNLPHRVRRDTVKRQPNTTDKNRIRSLVSRRAQIRGELGHLEKECCLKGHHRVAQEKRLTDFLQEIELELAQLQEKLKQKVTP